MTVSEWKRKQKEQVIKIEVHKKISNTFIESTLSNKTVSALKIIYYLANILKEEECINSINTITIDTKKMIEFTELKITDIKNNFKKLQETSISFINLEDEYEEMISLLPRVKINKGRNQTIEIDIYNKISKLIVEVTDKYSFINTKELMKLKFKHSIRLLPILKMINQYNFPTQKQKKYKLNELNDMFDTNYKNFNEIERKILIKAKEELDNNSSLTFNYEMNFEVLGAGRSSIISITIIPIENKTESKQHNSSEPTATAAPDAGVSDQNFKLIFDNVQKLELEKEFDISLKNEYLVNKFHRYLQEQVIVFKQFCIDNNKNYKNLKTSFKRHIKGAFNNNLDFFATEDFLNRKDFEDKILQEENDKKIKEFLQEFEGRKLCEYKFNYDFDEENLAADIYVMDAELYVRDKETRGFTLINDRKRTIDIINSLKKNK